MCGLRGFHPAAVVWITLRDSDYLNLVTTGVTCVPQLGTEIFPGRYRQVGRSSPWNFCGSAGWGSRRIRLVTPFMLKVSEVLDLPTDIDLPDIQASVPRPAAIGAEGHVECRSLAEQLVSEANVVLAAAGRERVSLVDEAGPRELAFTISFEDRQARVVTNFGKAASVGHLYGVGTRHLGNVELAGADQIERLILLIIGGDAVPETGTLPV